MSDQGTTTELWPCIYGMEHHWVATGRKTVLWTSGGTDTEAPDGVPAYEEYRCTVCNARRDEPVLVDSPWETHSV